MGRKNLGEYDRAFRGVIGIWLVVIALGALRVGRRLTAATAGIAGLGLLQNAVTGFCGGHWIFDIDTTRR